MCPKVVQLQIPSSTALYSSPKVFTKICSTKPRQEPQEAPAFVQDFTSLSDFKSLSFIAFTISPLQTPLHPQTSSSSLMAFTSFPP